MFALALLGGLIIPPNVTELDAYRTHLREVYVPFSPGPGVEQSAVEFRLYLSPDRGRTWRAIDTVRPGERCYFDVRFPGEGLFYLSNWVVYPGPRPDPTRAELQARMKVRVTKRNIARKIAPPLVRGPAPAWNAGRFWLQAAPPPAVVMPPAGEGMSPDAATASELVAILEATKSEDTFVATVTALGRLNATSALPAVVRNAERLGLLKGLAKGEAGSPAQQAVMEFLRGPAQPIPYYYAPPAAVPYPYIPGPPGYIPAQPAPAQPPE